MALFQKSAIRDDVSHRIRRTLKLWHSSVHRNSLDASTVKNYISVLIVASSVFSILTVMEVVFYFPVSMSNSTMSR